MRGAKRHRASLLFVFLFGAVAGLPRLPAARPADAPPDTFAAARAMEHVRAWAAAPRPSGSAAHAAVLDGLERELAEVGFTVERERVGSRQPVPGWPRLVNLVARPPGAAAPEERGGVWLVAHSDTVPSSPGAADDGLGLAVAVEAARALSVGGVPPDLHVLVTDGEERGLLGALAHVRAAEGPRRLVINVEARGTEGPAYMFQTAGPGAALLGAWRRSGCDAQATSLARAIYDELPNDTDFTVFRGAGWWGYDFALIHGAWRYHTPDDTPDRLDPRSVQQVGDCVVGLAREWLGRPLVVEDGAAADPVYAQVPGGTFVLPAWAARLAAAGTLIAAGWALLGAPPARRAAAAPAVAPAAAAPAAAAAPPAAAPDAAPAARSRAVVGLLVGAAAWIVALVGAFAVGWLLLAGTPSLRADFWLRPVEVEGPVLHYAAAAVVGMLVAGACLHVARRLAPDAGRGWHLAGVGLAGVVGLAAPTVGYVLVPGALVSLALLAGRPRLALAPAVLAGVLLAPVLYALFPALTSRMTPVLCVVPALLLGWLAPLGPDRGVGGAARTTDGGDGTTPPQRPRRLPERG